jgi:hypothetical protein
VPASLAARGCLPVSSRRRGWHPAGAAPRPIDVETYGVEGPMAVPLVDLRSARHLVSNGPQKARQRPSPGDDHRVGVVPPGHQAAIACAPPHVYLPPALLDWLGERVQPELSVATAWGGVAGRPGPFDHSTAGMGVAGCGDRPRPAPLTAGIFRGDQPQNFISCRGFSKRVRSPSSATVVTPPVKWPPRRARSASTTGGHRQAVAWSWSAGSRRHRRAVRSATARP